MCSAGCYSLHSHQVWWYWLLFGTHLLGMDSAGCYSLHSHQVWWYWLLFGTQLLGMDSAGCYWVHNYQVWTVLAAIGYTVIRYGQCWPLFGTQFLGMDSADRYSVHSHQVWWCWLLFGTQLLGMDSVDSYSVHSHIAVCFLGMQSLKYRYIAYNYNYTRYCLCTVCTVLLISLVKKHRYRVFRNGEIRSFRVSYSQSRAVPVLFIVVEQVSALAGVHINRCLHQQVSTLTGVYTSRCPN